MNSVHHNRAGVIEIRTSKSTSVNVREGNFDDEVRVTWILVRKSTEPQGSKRTLVEEYEDEAAERKATCLKHGSKVYPSRTSLATGQVCC